MPQLYIFLVATLAIAVILIHRHWANLQKKKKEFKQKVASRVEENRKKREEKGSDQKSFKEAFLAQQKKKADPKQYAEQLAQGEMAMSKGRWNEAKKHLIQASAVAGKELKASIKLAQVYLQTQDYKRAETLYLKLTELDQENSDLHQQLGVILAKRGDYKGAIQSYVKAVELDQKDPEKLMALGKLYHLLMRYSVAGECFRRAAELKPRDVSILFLLGEACQKDEDYENAVRSYERILTFEPYNDKAKNALAEVKTRMGEE